ncbi:alpha-ribazole phosphatase [Anaerotaenia torta]|uniref:histidine phosphatase family protein n=1 Tax=Anaerotaenia torta TaxID=433293 RepID=UPI003D2153AA
MRDRTENQVDSIEIDMDEIDLIEKNMNPIDITPIDLILIRHGETPSNESGKYIGRTDESLSEKGRQRLEDGKNAGMYPKEGILVSSPMRRCRETAKLLYGSEPLLIEEWREIDFGRFEGKNYKELCGDADYQAWLDSNGELPFPEGESREEFVLRCRKGLDKLLRMMPDMGSMAMAETESKTEAARYPSVIAAVHGGTIMALLSSYGSGGYFDYQCKNGEGYRCLLEISNTGEYSIGMAERLERKNG